MRFVLLGEPATGKSSLLVALYGALLHRRAGDMQIVGTVDDVEFLSRGLERFGRRESAHRTEADARARLALDIARGGRVARIELSDRSGEMLKHMIEQRSWDPELQRQLPAAAGALLFLRAQAPADEAPRHSVPAPDEPYELLIPPPPPSEPRSWVEDLWPLEPAPRPTNGSPVAALDAPAPAPLVEAVAAPADHLVLDETPKEWSPELMPIDARAVDLLQALLDERSSPLPLVVIVSAWDQVAARFARPGDWLTEHAPLLPQFLASHDAQLPHATFGVSAQGGTFDDRDGLGPADSADPWDRAFVVGPDGMQATFADPISWLIDAVMHVDRPPAAAG